MSGTCLLLALPSIALAYLLVYADNRTGTHPVLHFVGMLVAALAGWFLIYFFMGERARENQRRRRESR